MCLSTAHGIDKKWKPQKHYKTVWTEINDVGGKNKCFDKKWQTTHVVLLNINGRTN